MRAIRTLEEQDGLRQVPIMALLPDKATDQDRANCTQAGCRYWVKKPFLAKDIVQVVHSAFTEPDDESKRAKTD